tara:strand:- start:1501 stop:1734 length:234 start_codon:yes stop_codon:yes gene_type:complete
MQNKLFDKLIKEIAKKHGIPTPVVERAWKNQFKIVKNTISGSDREDIESFKTVYIKYLGKFVPRVAEMYHMNNRDDK